MLHFNTEIPKMKSQIRVEIKNTREIKKNAFLVDQTRHNARIFEEVRAEI